MRALIPLPHQADAVARLTATVRCGGDALAVLPVRSGKTLIGLWTVETLDAHTVLVVVPTLDLVDQTLAEWQHATIWDDVRWLAVASAARHAPATTDPATVTAHLTSAGRSVTVATYASLDTVAAAARDPFDAVVVDEAHHAVGTGPFAAVRDGTIPATRRIYLTGTPRRRRPDPAPRVVDVSLGAAIDAGIVADYRVVIAAVTPDDWAPLATAAGCAGLDPALAAGAVATVAALARHRQQRAVAYCSTVARARDFADIVGSSAAQLPPRLRPDGNGMAAWVSGRAPLTERVDILDRFARHDGWAVLANSRLLVEGHTLPADVVVFADPRTSDVEVTQAIGRALTPRAGHVATVVLPLVVTAHPGADGPVTAELTARSVRLVAGALRALAAHDPDLAGRLARVRAGVDDRGLLGPRFDVVPLGAAAADLADTLVWHAVVEAADDWQAGYAVAAAEAARCGHTRIRFDAVAATPTGPFPLGAWVARQRRAHKVGVLAAERVAALEQLPGWVWSEQDATWWETLEVARRWRDSHGGRPAPRGLTVEGVALARWEDEQRFRQRHGRLDTARAGALDALEGWALNPKTASWWRRMDAITTLACDLGRPVRTGDTTSTAAGEHVDGRWLAQQRCLAAKGRLDPVRAAAVAGIGTSPT